MESMNDIVVEHVQRYKRILDQRGIEVVFDLDSDMPKIYPDFTSEDAPRYITRMLGELTGEQTDVGTRYSGKLTKIRYGTLFCDDTQVIIIDHNSIKVPEDTLEKLNHDLKTIADEKQTVNPGGRGGNKRAAIQISKYGGRISIENYTLDREYTVGTTVQIPLC